jgi:hypothetical protein
MSLALYSHFHKDFPFNWNSKWIIPTYAGGLEPFAWHSPDESKPFTNVNQGTDTVHNLRHIYLSVDEDAFLRALGQQATEYWMWKNCINHDYIGCTTYRRYLLLDRNAEKNVAKIELPATQENANKFGSDEQRDLTLEYLQTAEVLTNHSIALPYSVEQQYLMYEPAEYWNLFKDAIVHLYPQYRQHMTWFTHNNLINFETTYIMRRDLFMRYASELFSILDYVWKNCSDVYPTQQTTSEPLPWRYPGFLGERFMPFFVYANSLKRIQVPLVVLQ